MSDFERLADVLAENLNGARDDWAGHCLIAVLKAMREPTEAQSEALSAAGKMWRELDSKTVWQTYIDTLLDATENVGESLQKEAFALCYANHLDTRSGSLEMDLALAALKRGIELANKSPQHREAAE